MKHANCRLLAIATAGRLENAVVVSCKSIDAVVRLGADFVPTVIPKVVDKHVEIAAQERPKRIVQVDGKAVTVAQHQPGALRVSVASQHDHGVVVHLDWVNGQRLWNLPDGCERSIHGTHFPGRAIIAPLKSKFLSVMDSPSGTGAHQFYIIQNDLAVALAENNGEAGILNRLCVVHVRKLIFFEIRIDLHWLRRP